PGVAGVAVVLAHRAPLALAQVRPPLLPRDLQLSSFVESEVLYGHNIRLGLSTGASQAGPCGTVGPSRLPRRSASSRRQQTITLDISILSSDEFSNRHAAITWPRSLENCRSIRDCPFLLAPAGRCERAAGTRRSVEDLAGIADRPGTSSSTSAPS